MIKQSFFLSRFKAIADKAHVFIRNQLEESVICKVLYDRFSGLARKDLWFFWTFFILFYIIFSLAFLARVNLFLIGAMLLLAFIWDISKR